MSDYIYSLEKHKYGKRKHVCPACGKLTFVHYIHNITKRYLHDSVGRCDRQDNCGYHYSPKQYHKDNNIINNTNTYNYDNNYIQTRTSVPGTTGTKSTDGTNRKKTDSIPLEYIEQTAKTRNSTLIEYFFTLFDWKTICNATDKYFIGCTKDRAVIFPQIDANGKVRTGKIQQYNPETGKRIKDQPNAIGWIHAKLKNKGLLPDSFELNMCLFGEHLIRSERYKNMPVGIVESEKTALIASACMPDLLWMAAGALEWLNIDKLKPLKERKIILYPDTSATGNAFAKWTKIAKEAKRLGYHISVSMLLENKCTDKQKAKGYDLGDYLIDQIINPKQIQACKVVEPPTEPQKQSNTLSDMISINPVVSTLIDTFDCVEVQGDA